MERQQPTTPDNWVQGRIRDIAYMGDMSIYVVQLAGGRDLRVTLTNVARKAGEAFTWDEQVYLSWDASSPIVGTG
jgi:putrescine transport system ATP-binding protein